MLVPFPHSLVIYNMEKQEMLSGVFIMYSSELNPWGGVAISETDERLRGV